ncbi:glycosyltransferase family 4 protein [Candidatus Lokiarchaeum ossiferum]|uniref:glycosyltransferase family 4 protein n=1 Tax=Candidatus Lokiarchaeum ossiferum TaxID=2951803 RepID=UPI00352D99D7
MKKKKYKKKIHIILLTSFIYPQRIGGVELFVYHRAKALSKLNIKTSIFCGNLKERKFCKQKVGKKSSIFLLPTYNETKILFFLSFIILMIQNINRVKKKDEILVIDAHFLGIPAFVGYFVSLILKIPLIITCHGLGIDVLRKNIVFRKFQNLIMKHSIAVFNISKLHIKMLQNDSNIKNVHHFPTAFGLNSIPKKSSLVMDRFRNNPPKALFVGRLDENKNPDAAIEIIEKICEKGEQLSLDIVGNGELKTKIQKRIKSSHYKQNLSFLGEIKNEILLEMLRDYDFLIMPSFSEGLPLTILEALSRGIICIVCKVGEIPNIIEDGINGFLFNPAEVEQAVVKIMKIMDDSKSISFLRNNAYNTMNYEFSRDYHTRQYVKNIITSINN